MYHLFGRVIPARFFLFCAVGLTGVGVHLAVLWAAFAAWGGSFLASQGLATLAAMTNNFFLNNAFTYGDQKLRGARLWRGLLSYYLACGVGSVINLALADWLYLQSVTYWAAGLAGAVIAAVWNFLTTASLTWGGTEAGRR
jgi:dolichol-phosphate mannosyltransferase